MCPYTLSVPVLVNACLFWQDKMFHALYCSLYPIAEALLQNGHLNCSTVFKTQKQKVVAGCLDVTLVKVLIDTI